MSVDFPRAWQIAKSIPPSQHDPRCSFAQTDGAVLCDCDVLMKHPETLDDVLQTEKQQWSDDLVADLVREWNKAAKSGTLPKVI